jgi:lipopolysaccharide transport system permease protein
MVNGKWLSEFWRYRELVYFLAWRDVKVRYKQAALGAAWTILQPLVTMVVFTFFFSQLVGVPSDGIPYPLFAFCGLVLWTYCSSVVVQGSNSLLANSHLITKVYFPRIALPVSSALAVFIDFAVGLAFLVVLMVVYGAQPGWALLWLPVFLGALVLLAVGTGMLLAAAIVRYRDIKHTIPFLIQLWMFVSPIIYPFTIIPESVRPLAALNPLAGIVEGFRACLFSGRPIDPVLTATSLTLTAVIFVAGFVCFRATERVFADII